MPLPTSSVFPPPSWEYMKFPSRRSVVHSTKGIVACTQPLAAKCGIEILQAGGNCADAAVAVAAGLNMAEPCSTGIGGDVFCLFFDAATGKMSALNGSGRMGAKCTLERIRADLGLKDGQPGKIPMTSVHSVTVPGAAAGWVDVVEKFGSGKVTLQQVLAPAVELGEKGFPVSEMVGEYWGGKGEQLLRDASPNFAEMLKVDPSAPDGFRGPLPGEIMKNPTLAATFRALGSEGKAGFYSGRVAEELVKVCRDLGGHIELEDLAYHMEMGSEPVEPISLKFTGQRLVEKAREKKKAKAAQAQVSKKRHSNGHLKHAPDSNGRGNGATATDEAPSTTTEDDGGLELWEHPPNGQGIVALMALGVLQELEKRGVIPTFTPDDFNTAPYLHAVVEALRIAFADANWWVADPNVSDVPSAGLVSSTYLAERSKLFDPAKAMDPPSHGDPTGKETFPSPALQSSDTVYFCVSDSQGNAISFINSNYGGFGTCIIPRGCGFTLQNRGANFALYPPHHPNILAPRKRPYHTIIPGAVTNLSDGSLHSVFGVMGGFMQPQGHVQVLLGQVVGGLNPQQALDAPRVCIGAGMPENSKDQDAEVMTDKTVYVEEGMPEETIQGLKKLGHQVKIVTGLGRGLFGRGQIIRWTVDPVETERGVWSAGSDMRGDGAAYPL